MNRVTLCKISSKIQYQKQTPLKNIIWYEYNIKVYDK